MQLTISPEQISLETVRIFVTENPTLVLSEESKKRILTARATIDKIIESGETVYGLNTGFGKFSETRISDDQIEELQRRIVLSHACGTGEPIPQHIVKTMMYLKVHSLSLGHSGCTLDVVELLIQMINKNVIPFVPQKGSVGASGDLAPLSHMALPLIGEGKCYVDGVLMSSKEAFTKTNLNTIHLKAKEGLAILNGTQTMAAYLSVSLLEAEDLIKQADIIMSLSLEGLTGTSKAFDERVHQVRNQLGQLSVAENVRQLVEGSTLVNSRNQVQDAYSLRCTPQVHGATRDTFLHCKAVLEREINGVTDNPLVFPETDTLISGGNFHGQPLALIADFMGIAVAELANISERRIAHMVDPHVSHLPAFLVKEGGLNSGYMIPQYTAAAIVSENKVLAHPSSVDSVPTSANKEDHVSMGTHASRKLYDIIDNVYRVLSIELLNAAQAIELHDEKSASPISKEVVSVLRETVPYWKDDRLMYDDMEHAISLVRSGKLIEVVEAHFKLN